jgi:hypothetical protein
MALGCDLAHHEVIGGGCAAGGGSGERRRRGHGGALAVAWFPERLGVGKINARWWKLEWDPGKG